MGLASVAVVDNQAVVRRGVAAILGAHANEFVFAGAYADLGPLVDDDVAAPEVVVLDLWLGRDDSDAVWAIETLRARGSAVLLHTTEERPVLLRRAVAAGVLGLALKNDGDDALLEALRGVAAGEFSCSSELASALLEDDRRAAKLAAREVEVLECLADGLTRHQVASRLNISEATVKTYLARVRDRYLALGRSVTNTASLIGEARRDGYA